MTKQAAAKSKNLNVQVPGETAPVVADDATQQPSDPVAKQEVTELDVALAADEPKAPRNYRAMHAHEIDPATLTAPVLTKDGYLCPSVPGGK